MSTDNIQISANISTETKRQLEQYVRARGVKKGFIIESALLHHLRALAEIPEDAMIPPRIVVTRESGERLVARLASKPRPTKAMRELFNEDDQGRGDD